MRDRTVKRMGNFIDGAWVEENDLMPAVNPATGEIIGQLPRSSREAVDRACNCARSAASGWAAKTAFERAAMCVAIAEKIDASREDLARALSLEQGKILSEAAGEVSAAASGFRMAAELVKQMGGTTSPVEDPTKIIMTVRQPRGVYGIITPWNFPVNIPVEYLAPAIATGNTVVWVPAPSTSLVAAELMAVIDSAGLPKGVVNLVIGEGPTVGDAVVTHPLISGIGFTGSTATGLRIAERGAGKAMLLELGGNGPLVVFEDADLDDAAAAAAAGAFYNAGQVCTATGRVLAQEAIVEPLAERIANHAREQVLGDPFHQGTTMGPLNNPSVAAKVKNHVEEALENGAKALVGGNARPDLGSDLFFEPTVLAGVTPDMRVNREETFGPVVPIVSFSDEADAMRLACQDDYGLSVGIFTADISRGLSVAKSIPAGIANINAASTYWEIHLPFGGAPGSKSGLGRLGGIHTLEAMTELKTITITTKQDDAG